MPGQYVSIPIPDQFKPVIKTAKMAGANVYTKTGPAIHLDGNSYQRNISIMADDQELFSVSVDYETTPAPWYWIFWNRVCKLNPFRRSK
jgi:hypothetical protein